VLLRLPIFGASLSGHRFYLSDVLLDQLFGLGFFIVLNAALQWERTRAVGRVRALRLLAALGLASYSLYLLHPALMAVLEPHVPLHGFGRVAGVVVMWLVIIGASYGFYLLVEERFVARSRQAGHERPPGRRVRRRRRWLLARRA
jgi:peptidoglycan/LPS O-acetylase OafA/YrhL